MRDGGAPVAPPLRGYPVRAEPAGAPVGMLWRPHAVVLVLAAYAVVHVVLRLVVSPVLTIDDSREAVFGQTLEWGYEPRQPPLYNWLVWGAFQLFGAGVLGLTVVKYALLVVAYAFLYLIARRVLADGRLAVLAGFSPVLMVPVGWVVHETITHNLAASAAAAATVYALVRLRTTVSPWAYVGLGVAVGLGVLSKFNYLFVAGALGLASLTVPEFRRRLLAPRALVAVAVAGALLLPYGIWFYRQDLSLTRMYAEQAHAGIRERYLEGVAEGLYYTLRVALYYLTPLWVVVLIAFRRAWTWRGAAADEPAARLLERYVQAMLAILVAGTLGGAVTYLKFRWLMPAFFLVSLYLFSRVDPGRVDERRLRRVAAVLLVTAVLGVVALVANVYRGDWFGRATHLNVPYPAVAARLAAAGFRRGTIVTGEGALGGNLRLRFPHSRIVRLENPDYIPPTHGGGQCLIVWDTSRADQIPEELRQFVRGAFDVELSEAEPARVVEVRYRHSTTQTRRVGYLLFPDGAGRCR